MPANVSVLVVDDHPANVLTLEAVLAPLPVKVITALSGSEALRLLDEQDFALVLMDVHMPELDGLQTTTAIRANPRCRATPVVLLTAGATDQTEMERGYAHGAIDYIQKPFVPEVVRYKVSLFVELYIARREVKRQAELLQEKERERADENEALLRLVIDQCGDGIIVADAQGVLKVFNPAAERQHGVSLREISAPEWARAYGLLDMDGQPLELPQTPLYRAVHGEHVHEARWQVRRPDGQTRVLVGSATPLRAASGEPAGGMLVTRDITEQLAVEAERARIAQQMIALNVSLEERVRERTRELEDANRELENFTYSVSHDLRAPLRHIAGFAELLEKRASGALDEKASGYLATITKSAQSGGQLVDDLLAFSRLGKTELRTKRVRLADVVGEVQHALSSELETRQIAWEIGELPDVRADPAMLRVALFNLMHNAVKYTRSVERPLIRIGAEDDGQLVHISVADNGIGFDMKYADKLYGIFQRLHSAAQFEGVGIGLANVRRVVTRHGGTVWAEGAPNQGATFHMTVPSAVRELDGES